MIRFICILDQNDKVILTRNYHGYEPSYIELIINSQIDIIHLAY